MSSRLSAGRKHPTPRVYRYGLRRQPAGQPPMPESDASVYEGDDGLGKEVHEEEEHGSHHKYTEGAGVYDRRLLEQAPNQNQNQNQNQVFSLENESDQEFLDEEPFKSYEERVASSEGLRIAAEVGQTTSSIGQWVRLAWSSLLLTIGSLFSSIADLGRTLWNTKLYRYGLLGLLLLAVLFYFYPITPGTNLPPVSTTEDRLPLNVEIFVKRLVEQQLARKQDDIQSRVMQKMAADKEELKQMSKEELLRYLDEKLNKMDTMIRSRLNAPTDDSQDLKDLETRITAQIQRLAQDIKAGKDVSAEEKRQIQSQLATLQKRISEVASQPQSGAASDTADRTELKELQKALDNQIDAHKKLELRLNNEATQGEARLQELASQFISSDVLKAEIVRINAALKQLAADKPAAIDEEALANAVLAKVLTRWNSEKDALLRDLHQRIEQAHAATDNMAPSERLPSAGEIVANQKDTIMTWIRDTVSHELKGVEADLSGLRRRVDEPPKLPTAADMINDAREVIHRWIEEQNNLLTPKVIEAAQERIIPELSKRINDGEKQTFEAIEDQRKQLEALEKRQAALDASISAVSKEKVTATLTDVQLREVVRLLNENRAVGGPSFDEDQVRDLVRAELELFAADRVNMSDWALGAAGARIIHAHTSDRYGSSLFGYLLGQVGEPPSALLTPSLVLGHCWAFAGERGNATIQLPRRIRPTAFSLDHVARGVARDFSSAPQHFRVWGYGDKSDLMDDSKAVLLGDYRYDVYGPQVQTFRLQQQTDDSRSFSVIKLGVYSNYGHEDYTCVYRFRVHGELAPNQPL